MRGPEGQPKGFLLDMVRPRHMSGPSNDAEYVQHIYMALGRARRLDWLLLRNFPRDAAGELDWSLFEGGPPDFLVEFMAMLEIMAKRTLPRLLKAQRELGMPAWEAAPTCREDPEARGRYLYDPAAWGRQAAKSFATTPRKRYLGKQEAPSPVTLLGAPGGTAVPPASPPAKMRRTGGAPASTPRASPLGAATGAMRSLSAVAGPRSYRCDLLGSRIGSCQFAPDWFNDPRCGAVKLTTGTQCGLTCGLFAVSHCLATQALPCIPLRRFQAVAGDGRYPEGDFDDAGLQRNAEAQGCSFILLQGTDYQEVVREYDGGRLAIFRRPNVLGYVIHMPRPRHWIALVPPGAHPAPQVTALLCDSLERRVYALTAKEVLDLFLAMGLRHMEAGESQLSPLEQEQMASE